MTSDPVKYVGSQEYTLRFSSRQESGIGYMMSNPSSIVEKNSPKDLRLCLLASGFLGHCKANHPKIHSEKHKGARYGSACLNASSGEAKVPGG